MVLKKSLKKLECVPRVVCLQEDEKGGCYLVTSLLSECPAKTGPTRPSPLAPRCRYPSRHCLAALGERKFHSTKLRAETGTVRLGQALQVLYGQKQSAGQRRRRVGGSSLHSHAAETELNPQQKSRSEPALLSHRHRFPQSQ